MHYARHYVRHTSLRFTVVNQCVDPPVPAAFFNTDSEKAARKHFQSLKDKEEGGGEFSITLYDHSTAKSKEIKYYRILDHESEYGTGYVYAILFPNSKIVEEFNYMDLIDPLVKS